MKNLGFLRVAAKTFQLGFDPWKQDSWFVSNSSKEFEGFLVLDPS